MLKEFEELAVNLCKRPGMYVGCESFAAVCAYLDGFDRARDEGPLMGFHQWMVLRQGSGNNVHWAGLLCAEEREHKGADVADLSLEQNRRCIDTLGKLLVEVFEERRRRSVTGILHEYAKWLLRKKWYRGPFTLSELQAVYEAILGRPTRQTKLPSEIGDLKILSPTREYRRGVGKPAWSTPSRACTARGRHKAVGPPRGAFRARATPISRRTSPSSTIS